MALMKLSEAFVALAERAPFASEEVQRDVMATLAEHADAFDALAELAHGPDGSDTESDEESGAPAGVGPTGDGDADLTAAADPEKKAPTRRR